ncbi:sulfurtransferase TusA family protein [Vibrio olivae]|uniref:Sulfurtransferase TusA family protein n=1 Tax=Vibrio olivae TaxID=1243002 RepID=A0ABV5HL57_9VIBR
MKPNILDLRDERCPMALLLAKRHINHSEQQAYTLWVGDKSAKTDIVNCLHLQGFKVECTHMEGYYCLDVSKGNLLNV